MTQIAVRCPPSLCRYKNHLQEFINIMLMKLDQNSHKNTPTTADVPRIIKLLEGEVEEFRQQFKEDKFDPNALRELGDTSNFAFLAFIALREQGVKTDKEKLLEEFFTVDVKKGKVYCKKIRSGSQYKIGEEIQGTKRDGYVEIKLQSKRKNCGTSVPRSHVVWYFATGKWPVGILDHKNRIRNDDRLCNLKDKSFSENGLNKASRAKHPFVTQYKPVGREHLPHYGKYVYQRHHKGVCVRAAYYDTPEQASKAGKRKWLKKIKEDAQ